MSKWPLRRKLALETRDALDRQLEAFTAAGLPTWELEVLRGLVAEVHTAWSTDPDALPTDERRRLVENLLLAQDRLVEIHAALREATS